MGTLHNILYLMVHHSVSQFGDVATLRGWHLARGFTDIGYHAVILNGHRGARSKYNEQLDGQISMGRSEKLTGAHCAKAGMNSKSLGVCLVGNSTERDFTPRQYTALVHYLAKKCDQYKIPVSHIVQHSDFEPGKPFCAGVDLDVLRARVAKKILADYK